MSPPAKVWVALCATCGAVCGADVTKEGAAQCFPGACPVTHKRRVCVVKYVLESAR